jgi:hypothetical protein
MGVLCLAALATGQQVNFDYDRSVNFSSYKTYQWIDAPGGRKPTTLWIRTSSEPRTRNSC